MTGPAPRYWQLTVAARVFDAWRVNARRRVLIAACPGAGKTFLGAHLARQLYIEQKVELTLIVAPTINVASQWISELKKQGFKVYKNVGNETLRERRDYNERIIGDATAIVITYAQLIRDAELFAAIASSYKCLLIADEIHHADEDYVYGESLNAVAESAAYKLALSGTPFNSRGGNLSMCEYEDTVDEDGEPCKRTVPLASYSYGQALSESELVCRTVEFIKHFGNSETVYKNITTNKTWKKVVDLNKKNKTDGLASLLDPNSEFIEDMLIDGLTVLTRMRDSDSRAAMLIVARDKKHGAAIKKALERIQKREKNWRAYSVAEIYNDTPQAHRKIESLNKDHTDIIISVRMISEGVDVKRLRVGVYATDYKTRMFFTQFVGRFIRYDKRLGGDQYAVVIAPAHIRLLTFAKEIEEMVESALIPKDGDGPGPGPDQNTIVSRTAEKTGDKLIWRGKEEDDRSLALLFWDKHPSLKPCLTEYQAAKAAREAGLGGASPNADEETIDWRGRNVNLVGKIVRLLEANGVKHDNYYALVNWTANKAVGIRKVDDLTPDETLKKRHAILRGWLGRLHAGETVDEFE